MRPTNQELADRLGLTHSGISRIRSGSRLPSIEVMDQLDKLYGWSVVKQIRARQTGTYAQELEAVLAETTGPGDDSDGRPDDSSEIAVQA